MEEDVFARISSEEELDAVAEQIVEIQKSKQKVSSEIEKASLYLVKTIIYIMIAKEEDEELNIETYVEMLIEEMENKGWIKSLMENFPENHLVLQKYEKIKDLSVEEFHDILLFLTYSDKNDIESNEIIKNIDEIELRVLKFMIVSNVFSWYKNKNGKKYFKITKFCNIANDELNSLHKYFLKYMKFNLEEYNWYYRQSMLSDLKGYCKNCKMEKINCTNRLLGYVEKIAKENKIESIDIVNNLLPKKLKNIFCEKSIKKMADKILEVCDDLITIKGAEFLLDIDGVKINNINESSISYTSIDFDKNTYHFFENLNNYFDKNVGINGTIDIENPEIKGNSTWLFKEDPYKLAVYIKYLCEKEDMDYKEVIEGININTKRIKSDIYYKLQKYKIDSLECDEIEKEHLKKAIKYIKNYHYDNKNIPYIPFRILLYTEDKYIVESIANIISDTMYYFDYIKESDKICSVDIDTDVIKTSYEKEIYADTNKLLKNKMEKDNIGILILKGITNIKNEESIK